MCLRMIFSDLFREKRASSSFSKNSRELFKELISTCDDNFNPIHIFSSQQLKEATNNYCEQQIILKDSGFNLYKGALPNCSIIVKKFKEKEGFFVSHPIKEIVFSSMFSSHSNVLNLLGCCLETECPILVFENAENGTLADNISRSSLPWACRIKIAIELCDAVSHLHNKFYNSVVHRDIKTTAILLDRDNSAKLFNFSLSLVIPDDESEAQDIVSGTIGYIAPEYMTTCCFNEKIDVYSIGVVMLQLLTGQRAFDISRLANDEGVLLVDFVRKYIREDRFNDIVDPAIRDERQWPERNRELQEFTEIAVSCLSDKEKRPTIVEVARQLSAVVMVRDINGGARNLQEWGRSLR